MNEKRSETDKLYISMLDEVLAFSINKPTNRYQYNTASESRVSAAGIVRKQSIELSCI